MDVDGGQKTLGTQTNLDEFFETPMFGHTLRFLINVLDQISVLVGNFVKVNKRTGPNKHTSAKLLAQKHNFL